MGGERGVRVFGTFEHATDACGRPFRDGESPCEKTSVRVIQGTSTRPSSQAPAGTVPRSSQERLPVSRNDDSWGLQVAAYRQEHVCERREHPTMAHARRIAVSALETEPNVKHPPWSILDRPSPTEHSRSDLRAGIFRQRVEVLSHDFDEG